MTRRTSIDAYNAIVNDGRRDSLQKQVYKIFYEYGPLTSQEMISHLPNISDSNRGSYITRISELVRKGVMESVGQKFNEETKMMNELWDVTPNLPIKLEREKRFKCRHCNGRGYFYEQQTRMNL